MIVIWGAKRRVMSLDNVPRAIAADQLFLRPGDEHLYRLSMLG